MVTNRSGAREFGRTLLPFALAACWTLTGCPGTDSGHHPVGVGGEGGTPVACDVDGDGHEALECGGDDCDDRNRYFHPGATETCGDNLDQNCSGVADEGCECRPGEYRTCYPPGLDHSTRNVGACVDGLQKCETAGRWQDACEGAVVPAEEETTADGVDQDCDGIADGGLLNRCGEPGPLGDESCGNGLDDDCDGRIDPPELCSLHCGQIDPLAPPAGRECCVVDPDDGRLSRYPVRFSRRCVEGEGLPACESAERECLALTPGAVCVKACRDTDGDGTVDRCLCGINGGGTEPEASEACGFATPCIREDCADKRSQPCYSGPPATLGVGICRAGRHSCEVDGAGARSWSSCEGEVLPALEVCGNGLDDDCDGAIDEADGATGRRCGLPGCTPDAPEICGNGLDDDCDGQVDEGCPATAVEQACFRGPASARGRGACRDGVQRAENGYWGPCIGDVLPEGEACGDGVDSDCNGAGGPGGVEDPGCCAAAGEVCDGVDQDCDGVPDDGVADACGACGGACEERALAEPADCSPGRNRACTGLEPVTGDPLGVVLRTDKREGPEEEVLHLGSSWDMAAQFSITHRRLNWAVHLNTADVEEVATAADNSAWFASDRDFGDGGLWHVSAGGTVLCRQDGRFATIALDPEGYVWAAAFDPPRLFRFHPERVLLSRSDGSPYPDGLPRCEPVDLDPGSPEDGLAIPFTLDGLTVDRRGILWGARDVPGDFGNENVLRLDTLTLDWTTIRASHPHLPVAAANGDAWFSRCKIGWPTDRCGMGFVRIDGDGPYEPDDTGPTPYQQVYQLKVYSSDPNFWMEHIAIDGGGAVWGLYGGFPYFPREAGFLVRFRPGDLRRDLFSLPAGFSEDLFVGLGVDSTGAIWTTGGVRGQGYYQVLRLDPVTGTWDVYPIPQLTEVPFTLGSDITGLASRRRVMPYGRWLETVDAGWNDAEWVSVDWQEYEPAGAAVNLAVRFAATREDLARAPVGCRFTDPPADLAACGDLRRQRYMSVEFELTPGPADGLPILRDIRTGWTRR